MTVGEAEALFLLELPAIERISRAACRRGGLRPEDVDDVVSAIRVKFLEHDYRVMRAYEGRCVFATYVTIVVQRFLIDYRNQKWGRWSPSAEAVRMGECAVRLESLLLRDGRSFDEACQILSCDLRFTLTREALAGMASRFPARAPRVSTQSIDDVAHPTLLQSADSSDGRVFAADRERLGTEASQALDRTIEALPPEDALLLRMRFVRAMTVPQIARATGEDTRHVYYRLERTALSLRRALESAGIDRSVAMDLLSDGAAAVSLRSLGTLADVPSNENVAVQPGGVPAE